MYPRGTFNPVLIGSQPDLVQVVEWHSTQSVVVAYQTTGNNLAMSWHILQMLQKWATV
jgi:hypothetical protein